LTSTIKSSDSDGKEQDVPNPTFQAWVITDQQVLSFLLPSMTKESLSQVRGCRTSVETWTVIEGNFTSVRKARTINSRITLATTKKGELSIVDYIGKMRNLDDELAAAGKPIDHDDLISYLLTSLNYQYNCVITTLITKDNLTLGDVYSQLLNFEQHVELQHSADHYANAATYGRGGTSGRGSFSGGCGLVKG
jgi:hypothetical protein